MSGQPRVVIEPHADDAFLSLGGHMERWIKQGERVVIVTVFSGTRKRARDAQSYAKAIGAEWRGLGLTEDGRTVSHYEDNADRLDEIARLTEDTCLLFSDIDYGFYCIIPVGIKHHEHILVREAVESWRDPPYNLYYLDQPYASIQTNGEEASEKMTCFKINSYLRPRATKYRHYQLFKDQAKFFHFNPPEKLANNIELLMETV